MLLAIDIGNTNIVIGVFENGALLCQSRLPSTNSKSEDDYAIDIVEVLLNQKIEVKDISKTIIASVVPSLTQKIEKAVKKFLDKEIFVIGKNLKINIDIQLEKKEEVGIDRLVNAVAAHKKFGGNLIIIDFGTATTFDVVGENGQYLGGVIAPGINLSLKALHDMTAQLPQISIKKQKNVIGKSTVEAMNSGVYFGYISLIEGMIKRIEEELGSKTTRIITGGLANLFLGDLKQIIDHHEPDLTLEGIYQISQN